MLTTEAIAQVLTPGSHGTTFGGNPLACAAAAAALGLLAAPAFLAHVEEVGHQFGTHLERLARRHPRIRQVRGIGLMWGAVLDGPGQAIVDRCRERGLLINCTAERVLRFLPPLVVTPPEVDEGLQILDEVLAA
jgi:acetylornithine/succinyldiaminopimelate/putrescine aminotransferase